MKRTRRPYIKLVCSKCGADNYHIQKPKGKAVEIEDLSPKKFVKTVKNILFTKLK